MAEGRGKQPRRGGSSELVPLHAAGRIGGKHGPPRRQAWHSGGVSEKRTIFTPGSNTAGSVGTGASGVAGTPAEEDEDPQDIPSKPSRYAIKSLHLGSLKCLERAKEVSICPSLRLSCDERRFSR